MTTVSRGHRLTITKSPDWEPDEPYWDWSIECATPDLCGGWWECRESHEVIGLPQNDGPWNSSEDAPWFEEEEFTFHGVEHTWRWGHGWTVPYPGCVVQTADIGDDVHEIASVHGEGVYLVEDDWDDTYCHLEVVVPKSN